MKLIAIGLTAHSTVLVLRKLRGCCYKEIARNITLSIGIVMSALADASSHSAPACFSNLPRNRKPATRCENTQSVLHGLFRWQARVRARPLGRTHPTARQ